MPDPGDSSGSSEPPERAWLSFDVVIEDGTWGDKDTLQREIAEAAAALACHARFHGAASAEACVALASDARVRALNRDYRGKDKSTNVLSFPAPVGPATPGGVRQLGDIVLADGVVAAEAAERGIAQGAHVQHLVVHGTLHLLGFDHETDEQAEIMERIETEVLSSLGIADPYAADEGSDAPARCALAKAGA